MNVLKSLLFDSDTSCKTTSGQSQSQSQSMSENESFLSDVMQSHSIGNRNKKYDTILGMVLVAIGTLMFCTIGAIVQSINGSVLEILEGRYILQNILSWGVWYKCRPRGTRNWYGDPPYQKNIWVRGIFYWLMIFGWLRGVELIPLGDAEAILFLSPVLTVIVARLYLKEKLPKTFTLTFLLTFLGVVFIAQPQFIFGHENAEPLPWLGLVFLAISILSWTAVSILVRTAKEAHWLQLEIVSTCQAAWIWTPALIILNHWWLQSSSISGGVWDFSWQTILSICAMAIMGFVALAFNIVGYQLGDATKVAWMEYLDLVFGWLYQWFIFNDKPDLWELIGACLLFSTCIISLIEELYNMICYDDNNSNNNNSNCDIKMDDITNYNEEIPLIKKKENENNKIEMITMEPKNQLLQIVQRMSNLASECTDDSATSDNEKTRW